MSASQHEQPKPPPVNTAFVDQGRWTIKGMLTFITWCHVAWLILSTVAVVELVRMANAVTNPF